LKESYLKNEYLKEIDVPCIQYFNIGSLDDEECKVLIEILNNLKIERLKIHGKHLNINLLILLKDTLINHKYLKDINLSCNNNLLKKIIILLVMRYVMF
jgi:hypothetical protein